MSRFISHGARSPRWGFLGQTIILSIPLLVSFLIGTAVVAQGAPRGVNTLSLGSVSGAAGGAVSVPLSLTNEDAVGGIQLDVLFDPAVVSFTGATVAARAAEMTIGSSVPSSGRLRVLMYFGGGSNIPAGSGAVANLAFSLVGAAGSTTSLTPDAVELSDPSGLALPAPSAVAGQISISGGSGGDSLTVGNGSGASGSEVTVPLSLRNSRAVKALQLDLRFSPAVVAWVGAAATARVGAMTLITEPQGPDSMRIVMYYADAATIAPGAGAIASLTFRLIGANGTSSPLVVGGVVVSDPDGQAMAVTTRGGDLQITGGTGDPTGACCATNGGCTLTTQAACTAGTWRGDGTDCAPNPCPVPAPPDTLAVGDGSGPSGGEVTIPISLANHAGVRGLQAEIAVDQNVVAFVSGAAAPRVGSMDFGVSSPSPSRVRFVMYYAAADSLPAGRGAVANLVFRLTGSGGTVSALTPLEIKVADRNNREVSSVGAAGQITVASGTAPPVLYLYALKNPGRTRSLQIFVSSDVALDQAPAVSLSGGTVVTMTSLPGGNIYQGRIVVPDGSSSVTVQATGNHDGTPGTAQVSVTF